MMPDPQMIAGLVCQAYGAELVALGALGNDPTGERLTYRVALSDGRVLLLRGYRTGSRMPFWYGGELAEVWLRQRACVLEWLAQQDYPAPRVVPTRDGESLATHGGFCVLALTYLPGQPLPDTRQDLRRLAGALGWLHTLSPAADHPSSWWHPLDQATALLLDRLDGVAAVVPPQWQPLHAAFVAALQAVRGCGHLPLAAIHGDCHPANAVATGAGQVALIDWDCAGSGVAVLDLGVLLLTAQFDPAPGAPISVNPHLVAAVVAGYRQQREPSALERACLLEATRFGVAFVGSLRFAWAGEQGWSERIERSLERLQARYTAAEEVARLAQEAFDGHA
jgi:Ser/Thr protein kinase RdoA (MazF antagonist)